MKPTNLLKEAYDIGYKLALADAGLLNKQAVADLGDMFHKMWNFLGRGGSESVQKASKGFKDWQAAQRAGKKIPDAVRFGQRVDGQRIFSAT